MPDDPPTAASIPTVPDVPPGPFTAISVAGRQACAWTETDETVCWAANGPSVRERWHAPSARPTTIDTPCAVTEGGETTCLIAEAAEGVPPGRYTAISRIERSGSGCGLTATGEAVCWGAFSNPPPSPERYTAITVRSDIARDACALTDSGAVVCWGSYIDVPYTDRFAGDYVAVQAYGEGTFCALTADGAVTDGHGGDCGFSTADGTTRYTAIALGVHHACALTTAGAAVCVPQDGLRFLWGELTVLRPPDPSPDRYTAISVGDGYACALTDTGTAVCWDEEEFRVARPDPAPGRYVAVSDGGGHTCAITEVGEAVCWGWNNFGQAEVPQNRYTAISAGETDTCALTEAGEPVCWGRGVAPLPPGRYTAISVGNGKFNTTVPVGICALTAAGDAVCAGHHTDLAETPRGAFTAIDLAWDGHACALTAAGNVICWGRKGARLGEVPPGRYIAVSVGIGSTCAIAEQGHAVCWGGLRAVDFGKWPGDDHPWIRGAPYTAISTGWGRACALTDVGEAVCWGPHQLWDGDRTHQSDRPPEPPPGPFTAISVNDSPRGSRDCALTEDGEVVCWGDSSYEPFPSRPWQK